MKLSFILLLSAVLTLQSYVFNPRLFAQQEEQKKTEEQINEDDRFKEEVPEKLKYYKEKYEITFDAPFEVVFRAAKQSIGELNCMIMNDSYNQTDEGLYKGRVKSDICVLVDNKDSTYDVLQLYSIDLPIIRGGVWANGGIQYNFVIKEQKDGKVNVTLKAEMDGFEEYVTYQRHYWESNGFLETMMLERLQKNVEGSMK
ncbi:MAG: hypothetical protein A2X61_01190 [Ignavibacteria bacterium GWB2_35_12]|nr:MAG: hypothetical protein A2X63_13510 [Ignavibacteria bacterium GWA2_35_8]OGU42027.1 MAG: hypothetical protein A2X61_01190 [Ignavibacteria bacterium GWB2_35_12]OGU93253.1 MAG: hypothetical protein A2220_02635 [Ignavibacteria bacterium RIFOXYA2_FULL_35_10]OGV18733.1 MAG: hypothetical protein A2475_08980 [Ignavibacteria bacterium RIFOXYC2_FULL_35_21]